MKKLLLLVLAILLSFSMVACDLESMLDGIMPSSSDNYDDDEDYDEDEEEEDEEDEDAKESSSTNVSNAYGPDTTVYSNEINEEGKWVYGKYTLTAPSFYGYYNGYKSALTMTFDDGYHSDTGRYINSVYSQYGFRGTAMLGPCFLDDTLIAEWNSILSEGYLDVGCHGYEHLDPRTLDPSGYEHEIKDAIEYLRTNFPDQRVLTFATPFAQINASYEEYLNDYVISNRLELGGGPVQIGEDYNLYRVRSYSVRSDTTASALNANTSELLKENGTWVVELYHCLYDTPTNSTDASKATFSSHCQYLYNNYKDTLWVASFEDVSIYLKQIESAQINYVASNRESMTINVTCPLDEEIYNYPMTLKVRIPAFATSAYAVIDGVEYDLEVSRGSGVNTVIVKNVPVNGDDVKIYLGGNYNYSNQCLHVWSNKRVSAACSERGYMLYECAICKVTYKNDFTKKLPHDFSGGRVTEKAPTEAEDGLDTQTCQICGETEEIITSLKNLASGSTVTATDGVNEWVYTDDMIDGDPESQWINGTEPTSVQLAFDKSNVNYVEITFSKYKNGQNLSVTAYNGEEWIDVATWEDSEETYGDSKITLKFDVSEEISSVKFDFTNTSKGCTYIYEINIVATIDK